MNPNTMDGLESGVARALAEDDLYVELEQLARGTLDAKARADLERRSASSAPLHAAVIAYEPFTEVVRQRIAARVVEALAKQHGGGEPALESRGLPGHSSTPRATGRVIGWRASLWVAAPLLAAAAAAVIVVNGADHDPIQRYQVELPPARVEHRDTALAGEVLSAFPGQPVQVVLRPDHTEAGPVSVLTYISEQGLPARLIRSEIETSASGTFRVSLVWPSSAQRGRLIFVVGRSQALSEALLAGATTGPGWQRIEVLYERDFRRAE